VPTTAQQEHACTKALLLRADPADSLGYRRSLARFKTLQEGRQALSLEHNILMAADYAGRADAATAGSIQPSPADVAELRAVVSTQLINDHTAAVVTADGMPIADVLSVDGLCLIHAKLCEQQPHANPGELRTMSVLAGGRKNCSAAMVHQRLKECLVVARELVNRAAILDDVPEAEAAAASVLLGLLDVHPFRDGNGRLARLVLSRVLAELGLPFSLVLGATRTQRTTFIRAVRAAISDANSFAGDGGAAMRTLIRFHAQRGWNDVERAWMGSIAKERPQKDSVIREDRASRRVELCCICMDEDNGVLNVATLCCGTAVHLNCLTKALISAEEGGRDPGCPTCMMLGFIFG
jgi:fido (protein-threonine AMPylation protein)